jgi:hypothetical protein
MFVQSSRRTRLTFDLPGLKPSSLMRLWLVVSSVVFTMI